MTTTTDKQKQYIPLAERMRPGDLAHFVGQKKLLSKGKILSSMIDSGKLSSIILWGPPGCGKTTLAKIIAKSTGYHFVYFSAVLSGVKEVRKIVSQARELLDEKQIQTLFFIDEIHRFNKNQQDAFLPHVESGLFTLIGASTENPSFQVTSPLLSRCRVLVLESLKEDELETIIINALHDKEKGLGTFQFQLSPDALKLLAHFCDGDARTGLNILEIASTIALQKDVEKNQAKDTLISKKDIEEAGQRKSLRYDKNGDEHYNLISALHKSLRDSDPDGGLYWLYRMLEAGEDPMYILRRLIRFASEDVGIADPQALVHTISCQQAFATLGLPEGKLAIAQAVTYLATAPKSNALYRAEHLVKKAIRKRGTLPVPLHLRNAPTHLMKELGYGKNYKYAHDETDAVIDQNHLPTELKGSSFYHPTARAYEGTVKNRLEKWRIILKKRKEKKEKNE